MEFKKKGAKNMTVFQKIREMCRDKCMKEGSSMVSVVIGVTFLAAIGLIALTAATHYITAVYVDRNSTDNFYQTEGILEEVKTGLVQYASESADDAYQYIMDHYLEQTKENKKDMFAKMFLTLMGRKLSGGIIPDVKTQTEDFGKLFTKDNTLSTQEDFFNEFDNQLKVLQGCGSAEDNLNCVRELSTQKDSVKLVNGKTQYEYVIKKDKKNGYSMTLKNLYIDYTDMSGYRSTIETDIVMTVPDYKFEGDSTLGQIPEYVSISDDTLLVNDSTAATSFTGNIYAGTSLGNKDKEQGIKVAQNAKVNFRSQKMISRGSIDILPGSSVDLAGESGAADLWLNNIRLTYDGGTPEDMQDTTNFTLNANSYIANDLDIATDNTIVDLNGKYYGYSYSKENDTADTQQSDYSSAILVNGKNTWLKANGLQKLILAGRTFVSRNNADGSRVDASDIMMGESLAVKSNQLAYLVPDKYIKPYVDEGEETKGKNMEGHNPVSATEKIRIDKDELLKDYPGLLNTANPFTQNYTNTVGTSGYVFYYLNFKDAKAANDYFQKFYTDAEGKDEDGNPLTNREMLDERAQVYISALDNSGMKIDPSLYLIAGNIVHNYLEQSGSSLLAKGQNADYYDNTGNPKPELLLDGKNKGCDYVGLQRTLLTAGSTGAMRLDDSEEPLVSGRIIDTTKLGAARTEDVPAQFIPGTTKAEIQIIPPSAGTASVEIDTGLVIAGENVEVEVYKDFTGLILSAGKVTIRHASNPTLKADMILLGQIMEYIKTKPELADIFKGLNGTLTDNPTDAARCISYDGWKKNEI